MWRVTAVALGLLVGWRLRLRRVSDGWGWTANAWTPPSSDGLFLVPYWGLPRGDRTPPAIRRNAEDGGKLGHLLRPGLISGAGPTDKKDFCRPAATADTSPTPSPVGGPTPDNFGSCLSGQLRSGP